MGPCLVVSFAYGFEPDCLGGETCGAMEVADGWLSDREFVHIVSGFVRSWAIVAVCLHVLNYSGALGTEYVV